MACLEGAIFIPPFAHAASTCLSSSDPDNVNGLDADSDRELIGDDDDDAAAVAAPPKEEKVCDLEEEEDGTPEDW